MMEMAVETATITPEDHFVELKHIIEREFGIHRDTRAELVAALDSPDASNRIDQIMREQPQNIFPKVFVKMRESWRGSFEG